MRKNIIGVTAVTILLVLGLSILASEPVVFCKTDLPEGYLSAIESQSAGLYSRNLPLVPVFVSVNAVSGKTVFYTIHFFPVGTVGMSYREDDGYNIEKPLTGA